MVYRWILVLLCILTVSCSASLPTKIPGRDIPIYDGSHPFPPNLSVELIKKVRVEHGYGCGGFGAKGTTEGVHTLLRNKAIENQADAVNVGRYVTPHSGGSCYINRYVAHAELLRIPKYSYTKPQKPGSGSKFKNVSYDVPVKFNRAWSALINAVSTDFFEVQNYEKDSGLLTLSFEPDIPVDYVNCGQWTRTSTDNYKNYSGPYVNWLMLVEEDNATNGQFSLKMKINLRVQSLSDSSTRVVVNTLYKLNAKASKLSFKFKAGSRSTKHAKTSPVELDNTRVCQSTNRLEKHLLNTIKKIASHVN